MKTLTYLKYRQMAKKSNYAWQVKRSKHLEKFPRCVICGCAKLGKNGVQVHHVRYRGDVGLCEQIGDLITLCFQHHHGLHTGHRRTKPRVRLDEYTFWYIQDQRQRTKYKGEQRAIQVLVDGIMKITDERQRVIPVDPEIISERVINNIRKYYY